MKMDKRNLRTVDSPSSFQKALKDEEVVFKSKNGNLFKREDVMYDHVDVRYLLR